MKMLSTHFSYVEMTCTNQPFDNDPSPEAMKNLVRLCETIMEPVRSLLNSPLAVHSGYRSVQVNHAVGGSENPPSTHLVGRACDFHPLRYDVIAAYEKIKASNIPYDKLYLEHKDGALWIHVQCAPEGVAPRRIAKELAA